MLSSGVLVTRQVSIYESRMLRAIDVSSIPGVSNTYLQILTAVQTK